MSEHVDKTIIDLQRHIAELDEQIIDTKKAVNSLCRAVGRPPIYSDLDKKPSANFGSLNGDEYYGKPLTGAARMILEARKATGSGPATTSEIFDALVAGGYLFETKNVDNAKRGLRTALTKASHTFHRLPTGKFGLLEWYPAVKAQKPSAVSKEVVEDEEGFEDPFDMIAEDASEADATSVIKPR